jgi:hypothetical protein
MSRFQFNEFGVGHYTNRTLEFAFLSQRELNDSEGKAGGQRKLSVSALDESHVK